MNFTHRLLHEFVLEKRKCEIFSFVDLNIFQEILHKHIDILNECFLIFFDAMF